MPAYILHKHNITHCNDQQSEQGDTKSASIKETNGKLRRFKREQIDQHTAIIQSDFRSQA